MPLFSSVLLFHSFLTICLPPSPTPKIWRLTNNIAILPKDSLLGTTRRNIGQFYSTKSKYAIRSLPGKFYILLWINIRSYYITKYHNCCQGCFPFFCKNYAEIKGQFISKPHSSSTHRLEYLMSSGWWAIHLNTTNLFVTWQRHWTLPR